MVEESDSGRTVDGEIALLASGQHGVVTTAQLTAIGLGPAAAASRARKGRLHRVHRGVYAVGHPGLAIEARWMAAVLACGDGAVLSHRSAAALWRLLRPMEGPIDVSVPSQAGKKARKGILLRRCRSLPPGAATVRDGIPVTAPWRTIEDLRGVVSPRLYRRAVRQAELSGYALAPRDCGDRTRSDLEEDFLDFVRRHRLPEPEVNVRVGRWEVDFLWRAARLIVETDSLAYHRGSVAFEADHQRDMELRRMGYAVRRYTGAQLRGYPAEIAAELGEVLRGAGVPRQSPRQPAS